MGEPHCEDDELLFESSKFDGVMLVDVTTHERTPVPDYEDLSSHCAASADGDMERNSSFNAVS